MISSWVTSVTRVFTRTSTPRRVSSRVAFPDRRSPKVGRISSPPSKSSTVAVARVEVPEVAPQGAMRELGDLPGDLHPRGAAADDGEGEPGAAFGVVLGELGHLERAEDPGAQRQRVVDGLHRRRVQAELGMAEVRAADPDAEDQVVVGEVARRDGVLHVDGAGRQVEAGDLTELHGDVGVPLEHLAQWWRHGSGRQDPGGDLVEQRLEEVVVGALHHRDVDVGASEELRCEQPAEATADDEHSWSAGLVRDRRSGS